MDFSLFGIVGIGAIYVICFLIGVIVKTLSKRFPGLDDYIPCFCGVSGAILGVVGYLVMPDYPAHDVITAIAVGIVSGFAATGVNEAIKQLKGTKDE